MFKKNIWRFQSIKVDTHSWVKVKHLLLFGQEIFAPRAIKMVK